MSNLYATDKLAHHTDALRLMARRETQPAPIMIDFQPSLSCNQHCGFCAYGHRLPDDPPERMGWKNFVGDGYLPWVLAQQAVRDWDAMDVKAVELTGGGEPLLYPEIDDLLELFALTDLELALVTNGTALTDSRVARFSLCDWKWARVSIDAGSAEDYCRTRRVPVAHWTFAWNAVRGLARVRDRGAGQRVGVGFVVDNTNYKGVYEACRLAKEHGADNVRLSLIFSPHGLDIYDDWVLHEADLQGLRAAEDLNDDSFHVYDLLLERALNCASIPQPYEFCGIKEVRCLVGGDGAVYSCCTLAYDSRGRIGWLKDYGGSFEALWESKETNQFLRSHNANKICDVACLYEKRNQDILKLLDDPPLHVNFV